MEKDVLELIKKQEEKGIPLKYDMCASEAVMLSRMAVGPIDALYTGFVLGYAQGCKATRKEVQKDIVITDEVLKNIKDIFFGASNDIEGLKLVYLYALGGQNNG